MELSARLLGEDGSYGIQVDPRGAEVGSVTVTLYAVPEDAAASATADGDPVAIDITVVAQRRAVTFDVGAGDRIVLDLVYSFAPCGVNTVLRAPSGSPTRYGWCPATIGPLVLQETGTYTVHFDPFAIPSSDEDPATPDDFAQTGSLTMSLRSVPY